MIIKTIPNIIEYTSGILNSYKPYIFTTQKEAIDIFLKNRSIFIFNILKSFEQVSTSLQDVEETIKGKVLGNISTKTMLKIIALNDAINFLSFNLYDNSYISDRMNLMELHKKAAKYEIDPSKLNSFRTDNVRFKNVTWRPPDFNDFRYYWVQVNNNINDSDNIFEKSLVIFLQLSRIQFFSDVNKRSAILFVSGFLMEHKYSPFLISIADMETFGFLLSGFYETGKANNILKFLAESTIFLQ